MLNRNLDCMKPGRTMNLSYTILLLVSMILVNAKPAFTQRGSYEIIEGEKMYNILPRDRIPAINNPKFKSVSEAEKFMNDDELVLGLVVNGDARAYSTWHLDRHEIVNDYVGEAYVSVTW